MKRSLNKWRKKTPNIHRSYAEKRNRLYKYELDESEQIDHCDEQDFEIIHVENNFYVDHKLIIKEIIKKINYNINNWFSKIWKN